MPAGVPPAGLDRRFLVADRILRNSGADFTVNYQAAAINSAGDIFIAGNNSYVGLMTAGLYGELVQGANLPASSTTHQAGVVNVSGGGWLVLDGAGDVFKNNSNDLSGPWSDITPPAVLSRDDLLEYNGALLTFTARIGGPPVRDMEFSTDDGATWDSDPGDFTGINQNLQRAVTNPAQNRILVTGVGAANVATTADQGSPPYTWDLLPINLQGTQQDCALSDDGTKGVVVTTIGQIWTNDGMSVAGALNIPVADNPFASLVNNGTAIVCVQYVADLQGFVLIASIGPTCAFIPEADMTQVIPGNYIGQSVTPITRGRVTDGVQALFPGSNNEAMVTMRNIGQSSRA